MICEFGSRGIAQILEAAGADCVGIDMEHTGHHSADIADLIAWFKATSIAPFVRIPEIQYHFIARTLDAGALGIMAPNVKNSAEARALVEAAKYPPLGKRGVMVGAASTDFLSVDARQYMGVSNET
jgi:2-dehydro-3-deoxyglucarate aldolase/4-hydroxy-2-oxoheptanedioate aldolase